MRQLMASIKFKIKIQHIFHLLHYFTVVARFILLAIGAKLDVFEIETDSNSCSREIPVGRATHPELCIFLDYSHNFNCSSDKRPHQILPLI